MSHTAGPWTVYQKGDYIQIDHSGIVGERPCIVMWTGFDSNDMPHAENVANAKLIAAAPDLLEACNAFVNYEDGYSAMSKSNWDHRIVRAAIAKATK